MEPSESSSPQQQMVTPDGSSFDESIEQLNSLVEFSSKFSGNNKVTYDTLLIDDPFKKSEIQKIVHKDYRTSITTLMDEFEKSLERLSYISREKVLKTYRKAIEAEIEETICKNEKQSMSKLQELYGEAQLELDLKNSLNNSIANSPSASDYIRREGSSEASKNKKRTSIPKETKTFLESVFNSKRTPNSRERQLIAEKCGLTPVQVRVWVSY
ncbi:POU domain, class 3, transcription factor 2 [Wickerhamomyces ciferrii]|uniref:POU domain, class 3, transcription factor 2 n=1 Tax=Wickerhamomyces ciferrii (strain ATCC 14091 / BCRC 22168 / CBS 111 / JCM 3599 / NBRC 0793 / NRRL Y-1031 F-60-10) TaxID=1206466 RepID=K0KLB9_WICCF|nr:POU domain, class 3, transcription factor 2 [Wickerhamomyces ciferrii]CCH42179.1 POU domain, class 3, transcription factor 2 [Wickerhamomyces ciferrii]